MPKLGLTMTTGTIVRWLKNEGDSVRMGEPLLEIETEKLSYSIESPIDGILLKKLAEVGEKYSVSSVIGYVGQESEFGMRNAECGIPGAASPSNSAFNISHSELTPPLVNSEFRIQNSELPASPIPNSESKRIFITPVAKKLAAAKGIDYRQIKGTGPNSRIVKADILAYAESQDHGGLKVEGAPAPEMTQGTIIPYLGLRRAVGETMLSAWKTIPMVTHQVSADVTKLLEYRELINAEAADKGERVTIGEMLLKLTALALTLKPIMNSSLTEEGITLHSRVHLGMATALDEGLIVPVIRDACRKGLMTISREAKDLAVRTREGKLIPDDVHGATFTVSNLGGYGSVDFFSPIINPPQAAILGLGRITDTVVPIDGEFAVKRLMGLSLTYDHRIIDGATAADFIKTLMKLMENPVIALLN